MSRAKTPKHTPGPWKHGSSLNHDRHQIFTTHRPGEPEYIAETWGPNERADASRIVECVNACEGIENPAAIRKVIAEAAKLMFRCDGEEGVQADGSNMCTLGLASALEAIGVDLDALGAK